jgi:Arc/MetJ-type ribon-helix-helix transcriptional regulator
MRQIHIRLTENQLNWLDKQKTIYGSRATAMRFLIQQAMERDNGNKKGAKDGKHN